MPTNPGEPMEELTPLEPSVAPPYNLIAERLFRARTVIISGEITQRIAAGVTAQMRDRLNRVFAQQTGQPLERIEEDTRRNFWLTAEEARRYGLVGRVIEHQAELGTSG